jgi:hypothetical protein
MHVVSTSTSNDDDAATQQWAPCSSLDDTANSNDTLSLPTIYSTRAGGGGRGRGLWTSNVVTTQEKMGTLGLRWQNNFLFDGLYVSEKVWLPYDINMLLD